MKAWKVLGAALVGVTIASQYKRARDTWNRILDWSEYEDDYDHIPHPCLREHGENPVPKISEYQARLNSIDPEAIEWDDVFAHGSPVGSKILSIRPTVHYSDTVADWCMTLAPLNGKEIKVGTTTEMIQGCTYGGVNIFNEIILKWIENERHRTVPLRDVLWIEHGADLYHWREHPRDLTKWLDELSFTDQVDNPPPVVAP